jgi:hypothetical protein
MNDKLASWTVALVTVVALLASCAAPSRIESNKAANYTTEPKRLFVLTAMHPEWGPNFAVAFEQRLGEVLSACGVTTQFGRIGALDLDEKAKVEQMRRFGPDAVLTMRRNGGTKDQYGTLLNGVFDSRLSEVKSGATVWRASSTVVRGALVTDVGERGAVFAVELSNKLKQDGIFRSCPIVELKK